MMVFVASRIERVTVFRRGARVERAIDVEEEKSEVRFVGLPLTVDDGTLRARVEGEGIAADVRLGLEAPGEDADLAPAIDAALEGARDEATRCRAEVARLQTAM